MGAPGSEAGVVESRMWEHIKQHIFLHRRILYAFFADLLAAIRKNPNGIPHLRVNLSSETDRNGVPPQAEY